MPHGRKNKPIFSISGLSTQAQGSLIFQHFSSVHSLRGSANSHLCPPATRDQALFSFRSVKHSGGTGKTKVREYESDAKIRPDRRLVLQRVKNFYNITLLMTLLQRRRGQDYKSKKCPRKTTP